MSNGNAAAPFESFFHGWLQRQQRFLDELLCVQNSSSDELLPTAAELEDLVTRVLVHYQQYYEEKSRQAQRNVFMLFSPPWFTAFEHAFFWIAGFKPTLAFRLVSESVHDLTEEQSQRMDRLRAEIRMEEKMLNGQLAKIQETVAAPPIMELARRQGQRGDGEDEGDEEAINGLRSVTEALVANADLLRTSTAAKVAEILNPAQNVNFFAAAARLQLKIRICGLERAGDEQSRQTSSS